jgi:uncharacterized short protein YbdD (DUF466 family)
MAVLDRIVAGVRSTAWFVRGVMGEDAYEKYLLHHAAVHGSTDGDDSSAPTPMTEREFWRDHSDRQDANPQGRCC